MGDAKFEVEPERAAALKGALGDLRAFLSTQGAHKALFVDDAWVGAFETESAVVAKLAGVVAMLEVDADDPDGSDVHGPADAVAFVKSAALVRDALAEAGSPLADRDEWQAATKSALVLDVLVEASAAQDDGPPPDDVAKPEVRGVTAADLQGLSQPELLSFNRRLHQLWGVHIAGKADPPDELRTALLRAKILVLDEFERRGIEAAADDELARLAAEHSGRDEAEKRSGAWIFGGPASKVRMAGKLAAMLPGHKTYVEPFCGTAAVFFAKEPAGTEVLCDADAKTVKAFRTIKALTKAEIEQLRRKNWIGDKAQFERLKKSNPSSRVDWIYKFLYLRRFSYGNLGHRVNPSSRGVGSNAKSMVDRLEALQPRLRKAKIFRGDYRKAVTAYDGRSTVFFFDPPYVGHDGEVGEGDFDEAAFFDVLKGLKGRWLLTYGCRGKLPGMIRAHGEWKARRVKPFRHLRTMRGTSDVAQLDQIIVTNYDAAAKALDGLGPFELGLDDGGRASFVVEALDDDGWSEFCAAAEKAADEPDPFAEVNPGTPPGKGGETVELSDVLPHFRDIMIRREAVSLVGSLPAQGETEGDIDVLIRGPFDEATKRVVEFRLGRALPPELSGRCDFVADELGGPFTPHVPLYDLALVARTPHELVRMSAGASKADDPLAEYPSKPGKRPAVLQLHFRGKSLHGDLRIAHNGHAVGWTMAFAQRGGVKEPVESISSGRAVFAGYDPAKGNSGLKPIGPQHKLLSVPKLKIPKPWLNVERVFAPGQAQAGTEAYGVMVIWDRFKAEFGALKPGRFAEYFVTGSKFLDGVLFFRLVPNVWRDNTIDGDPRSGRANTVWLGWRGADLLPHVVSRRAVNTRWMPPDGVSAMPVSLMRQTPPEFRFWTKRGAEAREVRDALVDERFFSTSNVQIVNDEFRRVETKFFEAPEFKSGTPTEAIRFSTSTAAGIFRGSGSFRAKSRVGLESRRFVVVDDAFAYGVIEIGSVTKNDDGWFVYDLADRDAFDEPRHYTAGDDAGPVLREVVLADKASTRKFALAWQFWKREGQTVRDAPTRQVWHVVIDKPDGGADRFELTGDPLGDGAQFSGVHATHSDREIMRHDGPVEPGAEIGGVDMNPTKSTPSQIRQIDGGSVEIEDERPGFKRLRFKGSKLRGLWHLVRESSDSEVWILDRGETDRPAPSERSDWTLDGAGKDPTVDRKALKPIARFAPMKPSREAYSDPAELVRDVAKPGNLELGLAVEGKYNGFVVEPQRDADGKVAILTDEGNDLAPNLPGVVKELEGLPGGAFIAVAEMQEFDDAGNVTPRRDLARFRGKDPVDDSDVVLWTFALLYAGDEALVELDEAKRRSALEDWLGTKRRKHVQIVPRRVVKRVADLRAALKWAAKQKGSEGALVKWLGSTYTLGGKTSSWWKLRLQRLIRAIVSDREPVKDSPGVWNYRCAVGPIRAADADRWKQTVEIGDRLYVPIGKTFNTSTDAKPGDVLDVLVSELLVDVRPEQDGKWTITWFLPRVEGKSDAGPFTPGEVQGAAHPDEVEKSGLVRVETEAGVVFAESECPTLDEFADGDALVRLGFEGERHVLRAELRKFVKADEDEEEEEEERYVLGIVLEPNDGEDGHPLDPDTQDDIYSEEEIRRAAHTFMEKFRGLGLEHRKRLSGDQALILESYLAPVEFDLEGYTVRKGTWLLAERILDDELWESIKSGDLTGYSMGGTAVRVDVE